MIAERRKEKSGVKSDWSGESQRFGFESNLRKACVAAACVLTFQVQRENSFARCDCCAYFLSKVHLPAKSFTNLPDCKYSFAAWEFLR